MAAGQRLTAGSGQHDRLTGTAAKGWDGPPRRARKPDRAGSEWMRRYGGGTARFTGRNWASGLAPRGQSALVCSSQLTCKFPYLFFPRDIHNAFGIVEKAFAQQIRQPGFELCPLRDGFGNLESLMGWLRTRHSAPDARRRTIKQ